MMKNLVVYYSFEGNTELIGKLIEKHINADLIAINPVEDLKSKGFSKYVWGGLQVIMRKKPELIPFDCDFSKYDNIFIGSPIWAGNFTPPIRTLLESGLISNSKIAYFYTYDGGAKNAEKKLQLKIGESNTLIGSLGVVKPKVNYEKAVKDTIAWVDSIIQENS